MQQTRNRLVRWGIVSLGFILVAVIVVGMTAVYLKADEEIGFTLTQTILNPTPAIDDLFGKSVAISGDKVLIGAPRDDTGAKDSGAAYLFDAATGNAARRARRRRRGTRRAEPRASRRTGPAS